MKVLCCGVILKKIYPSQIYIRIVITELVLSDKVIKLIVQKNNKNKQDSGSCLVRVLSAAIHGEKNYNFNGQVPLETYSTKKRWKIRRNHDTYPCWRDDDVNERWAADAVLKQTYINIIYMYVYHAFFNTQQSRSLRQRQKLQRQYPLYVYNNI